MMSGDKRKISRDSVAETLTISNPLLRLPAYLGFVYVRTPAFLGVVFRAPICNLDGIYVSQCQ